MMHLPVKNIFRQLVAHTFLGAWQDMSFCQLAMDLVAMSANIPMVSINPKLPMYRISIKLKIPFVVVLAAAFQEIIPNFLKTMLKISPNYKIRKHFSQMHELLYYKCYVRSYMYMYVHDFVLQ
jgi:hypothetical protein